VAGVDDVKDEIMEIVPDMRKTSGCSTA